MSLTSFNSLDVKLFQQSLDNAPLDKSDDILYLEVPLAICVCVIYVFVSIGIHYYKATFGHNPWIHEVLIYIFSK